MATATEISRENGVVRFYLSNKPELECQLDEEDYQIVQYNTCWFIHTHYTGDTQHYIRRTVHLGNNKYTTEMLHTFLIKSIFQVEDIECDFIRHVNFDGLDNTRKNLKLMDHK